MLPKTKVNACEVVITTLGFEPHLEGGKKRRKKNHRSEKFHFADTSK